MKRRNETFLHAFATALTLFIAMSWLTSIQAGTIHLPSAQLIEGAVKSFPQLIGITRMLATMLLVSVLTVLLPPIRSFPTQDAPK